MTPEEMLQKLKAMTLEELVMQVIWSSIMEGTAHCGWTDNARAGLVRNVQDSVKWAFDEKRTPEGKLPGHPPGRLNPEWVEQAMGFISAWTEIASWATAWFHNKRAKRSKG